ncbi:MAG TPA: BACON domain-containing protein [Thermoanaerobaculia bacterium]|nr:BACON domain-containing protein [Thermoanaerobaculia bacterium]
MRFRPALLLIVCAFLASSFSAVAQELPAFSFNVSSPIVSFPFRIVDAEFSPSLNAIVAVSQSPNQLHIYRPETNQLVSVNLEVPPYCVSVSPNGHDAVVGHDAWISHVDLVDPKLLDTIPVSTVVSDIVLGGNGWAYVFASGSFVPVRSINLTTKVQLESSGWMYGNSIGRLHPSGTSMYDASTTVSPADIEKIYIGNDGKAEVGNDSPYHGDYSMCGNLWFSAEGTRIYTACGNVFRASDDSTQDMRYVGSFSKQVFIEWAAHTEIGNNIAVLPTTGGSDDGEIDYFTPDFLLYRGKATLPRFMAGQDSWAARGRWVFFNSAGTKQYVVVQADANSGLTADFGLVTVDCTNPLVTLQPENASVSRSFNNAQFSVTGSPGCGWKSVSNAAWINTNSSGVGDGVVTYTVSANPDLAPRSGTISVGSATFTVNQAGLPAPAALTATASSATSVSLTWTADAADHYEVWRSSGSGFAMIATPATNAFSDTAAANAAYVYKVRTVTADAVTSAFSLPDYAHTFTLTDPVLNAGALIRASHVTQLRTIANAIRSAAGIAPASFTDASLASVVAKRAHMTELRDAINGARSALALAPVAFSSLPVGSTVRATTTTELRASLQ